MTSFNREFPAKNVSTHSNRARTCGSCCTLSSSRLCGELPSCLPETVHIVTPRCSRQNQDMDERAVIADLVKEAAGAYTTAASAVSLSSKPGSPSITFHLSQAVTALAEAEKNQPSKEDKLQECICAARGTAGMSATFQS